MSRGDFWSRRKAAVEAEEQAEVAREIAEAEAEQKAELEEKSDEEILEELGLPDPEKLEPGQDIAGFMKTHVPERLRQRALRQLWRLNPVLANLDGLCDYNDDFTAAATDAPGVATTYKVGKGLLKHIEALEEQAKAKQVAENNAETPEILSDTPDPETACIDSETASENPEIMQDPTDAAPASTTMVEEKVEYADGMPSDTIAGDHGKPRRMRFRIESENG